MTPQPNDRETALRMLLVDKGLRVTSQRLTVLRTLSSARKPLTHAQVAERLADAGLDRVTVYRNLLALTEAGILVRSQLAGDAARFELPRGSSGDHGIHPHFVCTSCGAVKCLAEGTVSLHGEAARAAVVEVQLRGRCSPCAR